MDHPGQEVLQRAAQSKCSERLRDTPLVAPVETYELLTIVPTQERWDEQGSAHALPHHQRIERRARGLGAGAQRLGPTTP